MANRPAARPYKPQPEGADKGDPTPPLVNVYRTVCFESGQIIHIIAYYLLLQRHLVLDLI